MNRTAIVLALLVPGLAAAQPADKPTSPPSDGTDAGSAAATGAPAEPTPDPTPRKRMPAPLPEPEPTPTAAARSPITWEPFGYLRMQYIAVQDDPNVQFVGRDDGFELQNARIGARGSFGHHATFQIAFDGAVDERAQINSPQGKLAVGLRDAWVDVGLGQGLAIHGGYFLPWVDPEAMIADTAREFVDHPIESRGMRATEGWYTPGLPPGRSMGASLRADPHVPTTGVKLGLELAIQNGADEYASNNDNNSPAISATLLARFPHDGWIMAAGRWNPRTIGNLPFRQDETDLQGTVGLHLAAGPVSIGGGAVVQHTTFESTGGPSQDAYGAHAQLMIAIPAALPFAVGYRFGVLDPSSLITTDQVMEHTLGAVLGVPSLRMRFQLQLTHVVEQAARDLSNDRAQLAAEVAL